MARGDTMRRATKTVAGVLAIAATLVPPAASAASFDCNARGLSRAEGMICEDPQLSRADEQLARRGDVIARRMNYGQYLGLRHWQAASAGQRDLCGANRACIDAHYRAQRRFFDRLQQCLDTRYARRSCLRETLAGDRETVRRN
jgi:uncharacterized protein